MSEKLKPCPFCGGKATVFLIPQGLRSAGLYTVGCTEDAMCFGNLNHVAMVFVTRKLAEETWNRRADNDKKDI